MGAIPCNICGYPIGKWSNSRRMFLCNSCRANTPRKIGRADFDRKYWGSNFEEVNNSIRREFYDDYKTSNLNFDQYKEQTTGEV